MLSLRGKLVMGKVTKPENLKIIQTDEIFHLYSTQ